MRLGVSNIGWAAEHDARILPMLRDAGAEAIEVAPGRVFDDPAKATIAQAKDVGSRFTAQGLPVVSMQALLFGRPELRMFGDANEVQHFQDYLGHVIGLAGALGCGPLVFGSPKNRLRGAMSFGQAVDQAALVLEPISEAAAANGCVLCLEANATGYGCDFMTVLEDAVTVAKAVGHRGVGVVVDTGNMIMEHEQADAVANAAGLVRHLHLSAPGLAPISDHAPFIADVLAQLSQQGYDGSVTLEMRTPETDNPLDTLLENVALARAMIDAR